MQAAAKQLTAEWRKADATIDRCENELCERFRAAGVDPNPVEIFRRVRVCRARLDKMRPQYEEVLAQQEQLIKEYVFAFILSKMTKNHACAQHFRFHRNKKQIARIVRNFL